MVRGERTSRMKGDAFLAWVCLPSLPLFHGLQVQHTEHRKLISKNPKSYFAKSLQNTKAQITLFEDCCNRVSEKRRRGEAPGGIWCTWPDAPSEEAATPEGRAAPTGNPRDTLVPKEEASGPADCAKPTAGRGSGTHGRPTCGPSGAGRHCQGLEVLGELSGTAFQLILLMKP